jgi:squalene synthase HpnC
LFLANRVPIDHYENFPVASVLLPAALRRPIEVIYRFARSADDFADEGTLPDRERLMLLAAYGDELRMIERGEPSRIALFQELAVVIRRHQLPLQLFHDLLSAFAQDVSKKRYADYTEVLDYCRRSANPVGRLLLVLYNAATPQNLKQSDHICSALQIINFLQDIAIDYAAGRIYMPQDELARFGIDESLLASGNVTPAWHNFMTFQINRTRRSLLDGAPLGRALKGRIGLEMRMIIAGGDRILGKIAAVGGDVFRRRPVLRAWDWPLMMLGTLTRR